jgi:hypothetical protein
MLAEAIKYAMGLRIEKGYSALVIKPRRELPGPALGPLESRRFYRDYWIDLGTRNLDALWRRVSESERRKIRKADKISVEVYTDPSDQDIAELNSVMLHTTKRHNVPAYPKTLLHFFREKMAGYARIYFAKLGGRVIAGIVVLSFRSTSIYGYGFGLSKFFYTGCFPRLLWQAISDGHKESKQSFDLGISSPNDEGLSSFKVRLGGVCEELPFYYEGARFEDLVFDPNSSERYLSKLYGLMPLRLHSILGPRLVSRFG